MKDIAFLDNEKEDVLDFYNTLKLYSIGVKPLVNSKIVYICCSDDTLNKKLIFASDLIKIEPEIKVTILHTFESNLIELLKEQINQENE